MRWTLLAAAAVAVLSLSGGSGGGAGPRVELVAGSLSLVNSLEGQAVFSTDNLGPGHSAGGTVTVANTGTLPGALSLAQSAPTGSALAGQLRLAVRDLTVGTTVYSGPLTGLGTVSLGTLGAGAARVYGFTATLPASAGDRGSRTRPRSPTPGRRPRPRSHPRPRLRPRLRQARAVPTCASRCACACACRAARRSPRAAGSWRSRAATRRAGSRAAPGCWGPERGWRGPDAWPPDARSPSC